VVTASALDIEADSIIRILEAMQGLVMDGDHLTGWERRQPSREDSSAERTKNWRLRHNASQTIGDARSVSVTRKQERNSPFNQ
jgi:hypothetical protein